MKKYIERKLFLILLGYMGAYHVVYIFRRVVLKAIGQPDYVDLNWWQTIFGPILANFIIVPPIILLVLIATKIMINRNLKWTYVFIIHFVLSFVYSLLITGSTYIYLYFARKISLLEYTLEEFFVNTLFGSNLNFLGYVGFVTIIYSYYYIQRISTSEIQKVQLSRQLQNVKMQALKSQLNPHFLFNTLNSISSLIKEDANKAQRTISNLGDLLREVLLIKDENLISVYKEMLILKKYVDIMQTRFSDHLLVEIKIEKEVEEALIPSMLLQPIVENSFEHGYSYESTDLRVNLSISKMDEWLEIQIQNNGAPISLNNTDSGLGLRNVQERLETLFGEDFYYSFSNLKNGDGVLTNIKIPLTVV